MATISNYLNGNYLINSPNESSIIIIQSLS